MWDPDQYLRFAEERARPFHDLLARVPNNDVHFAVDLGCGPGGLTKLLAERWPGARVVGVDISAEMLAKAQVRAMPGRLQFVQGDIGTWQAPEPADVIVSNAALHWVRDHERVLRTWTEMLTPGGTLAVQMPNVFHVSPARRAIMDVVSRPRWRHLEAVAAEAHAVEPLLWYVQRLVEWGLTVDAWETTYIHILPDNEAVLEWLKGTTLRPILGQLSAADTPHFLRDLAERLKMAYPHAGLATMFPFPRLFFIARRG